MKIVHLLSQVELTGAEVYAIDLTDELIKLGHTCYIVSDKIHKRTKATFIPLTIHDATFFRRLRSILFLRQFINSNKISLVHAHSRAAVRIGFWATRFSGCALVSTLHGKQHFSYSKKLFNIYGENILSVCENIKLHFTKHFGFHESQLQITRNFLNTDFIDGLTKKTSTLYLIEPRPKTISFLGRTTGPKGLNWEYLINSYVEGWLIKFPDVLFQFGGGEVSFFSEATQQKIKRLTAANPNQFRFLGKMDHLFQTICTSDIILGSGRIAIEGLYLKKTVLALGEELYLGRVTPSNFTHSTESNFGDIDSEVKYTVDYEQLKKDVEATLIEKDNGVLFEDADRLHSITMAYFNKDFEVSQMIETYEWACFKRRYPGNIPILMYHQIVDPEFSSPHKIYVTEARFEEHLNYLKSSGFTAITFGDLKKIRKDPESKAMPKKPVIISFDDGYENNLKKAVPLLQKYQMRAVFYLLAKPHETNFWDANSGAPLLKLLDTEERRELSSTMEIGSHGFNHEKLSTMNFDGARREMEDSKFKLEQELGVPIYSYAYTYGDRSDRDIYLAKKAGYDFAVNTTQGVLHFADNPQNLFRISIFPTDTIRDLKRKTRSWYRLYYLKKRKE